MSLSDKFCLRWNEFQNNVSKSFSQLRRDTSLVDVTLISRDQQQISAHRMVMSMCSGFFKNIFCNNPHSHPLLYLDGIDSHELQLILDYMYHGEVKIFHEHLDRFLDIAQKFKLEGLLLPQQEYENNMKTSSTFKGSSEEKECKRELVENILIDNNVAQDRSLKVFIESIEASNSEVESKFLELVCLKDKIYTCTICEKTMNHKGSMRRHLETHLTGLSYECSWCAQVFNTRMQLANHKRIHNK